MPIRTSKRAVKPCFMYHIVNFYVPVSLILTMKVLRLSKDSLTHYSVVVLSARLQ